MKQTILAVMIGLMLATPTMAKADNTSTVIVIGGVGVTVLGVVVLLAGEKDYTDNKNDWRVSKSEADRVHKNYQVLGGSLVGVGVLGVMWGMWRTPSEPETNISVERVNSTDVFMVSRAF